jgi:hypothetical protein
VSSAAIQNFTYSILYGFARRLVATDAVCDLGTGRERLEIDQIQDAGPWGSADRLRLTAIIPDHLSPAGSFIDAQGV